MAKDKNKVAPADGALVKQGSAKRRNRKAWPGDEEQDKSPKSGKRRDSKKKKKSSKAKEETKEETSSPQRGKQFKAPTQKKTVGSERCRRCREGVFSSGRRPVGQVRHGRRGVLRGPPKTLERS